MNECENDDCKMAVILAWTSQCWLIIRTIIRSTSQYSPSGEAHFNIFFVFKVYYPLLPVEIT